jgi:uncharacterized protein YoxC
MFNLTKIKQIFMSTKQEVEQQLQEAIAVAQRLNEDNKGLKILNESLIEANSQLTSDFNSAVERVRYLDGQVKMLESQNKARNQFSDSNKNY